jgi:hypothetical protein
VPVTANTALDDTAAVGNAVASEPRRWSWWPGLVAVASLPVVLLLVLRVSPYFGLNNGDPFVYVGYSNDFRNHVHRFGYTYHSVRFGLIFPLRASLVFGPVWGYFILRYLLYLLAIVPMYFALKPYGRRLALLGPVLFVANPVAAQAIMTTHPDTIVVPAFTAVVCLLALCLRQSGWKVPMLAASAGLVAGIALNANLFVVPLLAMAIGLVFVLFVMQRRLVDALSGSVAFVLAAGAVCLAGMLVYRHLFDDANIYRTSFNAMNDISDSTVWRSPSYEWLGTRRYIYAPLFALLLGAVALVRQRRSRQPLAADRLFLFAVTAASVMFFVAHQFLFDGASLEIAYYFSYVIGPVCLLVAAAAAWLGVSRVSTAALLVVPVALAYASQLVEIHKFVVFVVIAAALVAVAVRSTPRVSVAAMLLVMNLAWGASPRTIEPIAGAGFQYEPHYENAFGEWDDHGFEEYRLASKLHTVLPSKDGNILPLLFWYRTGDGFLDAVEASYHWETLAVQRFPAPGMPSISTDDLARLRALVGGYVVLLARTPNEIGDGVESLRRAGFGLEPDAAPRRLRADDATVFVLSVRLTAAPQ